MIVMTFGQAFLFASVSIAVGCVLYSLVKRLMAHAARRLSTLSRRIWKK